MMRFIGPRLRAPIAILAWGAVLAAAIAIGHGGAVGAAAVAVFMIAVAVFYYGVGGRDSDYGALIGGRADERQALIRTRARAVSGTALAAAALAGAVVELALGIGRHLGSLWSCQLLIIVGAVSYLTGLRRYGARGEHEDDPGPGDDTDEHAPAPKPTLPGAVATGG